MTKLTITLKCLPCGFKGKGTIEDKKPWNKTFVKRKCPMCKITIDLDSVSPKPWLND